MPELTGNETRFDGEFGWSEKLLLRSTDSNATLDRGSWFFYAPQAHPMWAYHVMYVVSLADTPGIRRASRQFEGATHEIGVMAINPEFTKITSAATYLAHMRGRIRRPPQLLPHDVCEQVEATDDEARKLSVHCAWGVANGFLIPDSDYRPQWLSAIVNTLAHYRNEAHVRPDGSVH